jgi:hypothetical protein
MTFEDLIEQARKLPVAQRKVLISELVESLTEIREPVLRQKRIPGLHAGQGWVSDDFNDELPDAFWFEEEE